MTIGELLRNVQQVSKELQGELVRDVVFDHQDDIIELQRYQLLEGKASNGEDIRPYYTEDIQPMGYFTTKAAAERYMAWKETLSYPYQAHRNSEAPNLYINGKFHSELGVRCGADAVEVAPITSYASEIVAKYGINTFGLTKENWNKIWRDYGGLSQLIGKIKRTIFG